MRVRCVPRFSALFRRQYIRAPSTVSKFDNPFDHDTSHAPQRQVLVVGANDSRSRARSFAASRILLAGTEDYPFDEDDLLFAANQTTSEFLLRECSDDSISAVLFFESHMQVSDLNLVSWTRAMTPSTEHKRYVAVNAADPDASIVLNAPKFRVQRPFSNYRPGTLLWAAELKMKGFGQICTLTYTSEFAGFHIMEVNQRL